MLLINGMWMTHEMMLPYVDQLMDDYFVKLYYEKSGVGVIY